MMILFVVLTLAATVGTALLIQSRCENGGEKLRRLALPFILGLLGIAVCMGMVVYMLQSGYGDKATFVLGAGLVIFFFTVIRIRRDPTLGYGDQKLFYAFWLCLTMCLMSIVAYLAEYLKLTSGSL